MMNNSDKDDIGFAFKPNKISRQITTPSPSKTSRNNSIPPTLGNQQSSSGSTPASSPHMSPSTSSFFKKGATNKTQLFRSAQKDSNIGSSHSNQSPNGKPTLDKSTTVKKASKTAKNEVVESYNADNNKYKNAGSKTVKSLDVLTKKLKSFSSPTMPSSSNFSTNSTSNKDRSDTSKQYHYSRSDPALDARKKGAASMKSSQQKSANGPQAEHQLRKSISQPNLNSSNSRRAFSFVNSTSSTKAKRVVKGEQSVVSVNDSEDDMIDVTKTLNHKKRENSEDKARIQNLEEILNEKDLRIQQLEEDEKLNIKLIEYNLANYSRDKKRMDALTADLEIFKCIFHDLKSILEIAQHEKEGSENDFEKLSEIVVEERDKREAISKKCKAQFEKLFNYFDEQFPKLFEDIKSQQTVVQNCTFELKSLFSSVLEDNKQYVDYNSDLKNLFDQIKTVSKDIALKASNIQCDHKELDTVIALTEANKDHAMEVYKTTQELDSEFENIELLFKSLQDEVDELKKEKLALEADLAKSSKSVETIREEVKSELYESQNENALKILELHGSIMALKNEKLTWEIEKRELCDINKKLTEELGSKDVVFMFDNSKNVSTFGELPKRGVPAKSKSDSLLQRRSSKSLSYYVISDSSEEREDEQNDSIRVITPSSKTTEPSKKSSGQTPKATVTKKSAKQKVVEAMKGKSVSTAVTSKNVEEQTSAPPNRRYNTRRNSYMNKNPLVVSHEDTNREEVQEPDTTIGTEESAPHGKKRRRIRKLPGSANDEIDDSDEGDISKKITKALEAALPESAKDAHISKKKK